MNTPEHGLRYLASSPVLYREDNTFPTSILNAIHRSCNPGLQGCLHMAQKTFESALRRLEQITTELEEGELPLEKSLKKFDEGISLVSFCSEKLEEARLRVDLLLKKDNNLTTVPFEDEVDDGGGA